MKPHFKARWHFHFKNVKPRTKTLAFPESGMRRIPMEFAGSESGLNTVSLTGLPNMRFGVDDVVECDCETISYRHLHPYIIVGARVRLWDGDFFADGSILEIYPVT